MPRLLPLVLLTAALSGKAFGQGVIQQKEPDDSILTANDTGFTPGSTGLKVAYGHSSDGDYGETGDQTGDFDFYKISAAAGQTILVDLKNFGLSSNFDSFTAIYRYDGTTATKVAENDDVSNGVSRASRLTYTVPAAGNYYVVVSNWINVADVDGSLPRDPLTPGTGFGLPGGTGGPYQVFIGLDAAVPVAQFDGGNYANPVPPLRWSRVTGETGYRQTAVLKISNTGTAAWAITESSVTGPDAAKYTLTGLTTPLTLAPGAGVTVNLSYLGDGVKTAGEAALKFTGNDPFAFGYSLNVSDSLLTGGGRFAVRQVHAVSGVTVNSFDIADEILSGTNAGTSGTQQSPFINYSAGGVAAGYFGGESAYPDPAGSGENFVLQGTGRIFVRKAGTYTFRGYADDGQRLQVDGEIIFATGAANTVTFGSVDLTAGEHELIYTQYETGGGDHAELSIAQAQGAFTTNAEAVWELLEAYNSDADGDGLPNDWETAHSLNPNSAAGVDGANGDPDNDGLGNLGEYLAGTDPRNPDTDGDGLKDGVETKTGVWVSNASTGTDPLVADSDGDGLPDGVEDFSKEFVNAAQPGTDPNKKDTDSDGFADLSELTLGTNPKLAASFPDLRYQTVLAENFDGGSYHSTFAFTSSSGSFVPEVTETTAASNGKAAQLTAAQASNNNSIAWDVASAAPAQALQLTFDFRISNEADPADGLGIGLFRTGAYGTAGELNPGLGKAWENPTSSGGHADAVVLGFGVYGTDIIRLAGPAVPGAPLGQLNAPFTLSNGLFNRATLTGVTNGPASTVFSLEVIQDVNGAATRHVIFSNVVVPGFIIGNETYRLIAGGRTGASVSRIDLDNVRLAAIGQPQPVVRSATSTLNSIRLELEDNAGSVVNAASLLATLNGAPVVLTVSKTGGITTAAYTTPEGSYLPAGANLVVFTYADTAGRTFVENQTFTQVPYKILPASLALPSSSAGEGGFDQRVVQVSPLGNGGLLSIWEVAEGVLDGVSGQPFNDSGNLANLTGAVGGHFISQVINYEQEGLAAGYFPGDTRFPGIPGTTGSNDYFVLEALTWVNFPEAGFYTLGVNTDDGYRVSYGHDALPALRIVSPASGAKIIPVTPSLTVGNGGFGAAYPDPPITAKLVLGNPILGESPYTNAEALNGNIAVVERGGGIAFTQKAQYALDAGAVGVLVINQTAPTLIAPVSTGTNVNIPYGHISITDGNRIKALIAANPGGVLATLGTERSRLLAESSAPANTTFGVVITQPGLYPLRFAQLEVTGGASAEWYSVANDGTRHLLNDAADPQSLKAYASATAVPGDTPLISISRANGQVVIQYTGVLQFSPDLATPFTDVAGAASPYTVPAGSPARLFFRARP